MKYSFRSYLGIYTIGVAALFLAGFFLLVVFGAQSYRGIVAAQTANNTNRALLSYFATCINSNDANGAVYISDSEYGQVLEIPDGSTGYGLRIYACGGKLYETYEALDAALNPEEDIAIGDTQVFRAEFVQDGLLRITTDAGSTLVALRSEGSGRDS